MVTFKASFQLVLQWTEVHLCWVVVAMDGLLLARRQDIVGLGGFLHIVLDLNCLLDVDYDSWDGRFRSISKSLLLPQSLA